MKKYIVRLTPEEQTQLLQMIRSGKAAARTLLHARILLKADAIPAWSDEVISEALEVQATTVARVRQRFVEEGLDGRLTTPTDEAAVRPQTRRCCRSPPAGPGVQPCSGGPSAMDSAFVGR